MIYINVALGMLFLFLLGRYVYSLYREGFYRPEEWAYHLKEKKITPELYTAYRRYKDKIRFFSWWLQVEQLKKKQVVGAFAELGVYKGESARVLHLMDTTRTFHLFDTFEGFKAKDLASEKGEAASYSEENFADTSLDLVRKNLGNSPCFVFHPGIFPATAAGLEKEVYALVNIDADLYQPIKSGLEYFYPRLSPGGVIFVHDFNYKWEGCCRAVKEFLKKIPEEAVFLPDQNGTVVIIRNNQSVK